FFSSRRRHTRFSRDWSSDVCSSDLDVMLVLFCLWRGLRQGPLSGEAVAALDGAVAPWRDQVVRPLRGARRWLKEQTDADGDGLRAAIAAAELRAEQAQGRLLVNALEALPLPAAPPGI